jgi:hypothetical protein
MSKLNILLADDLHINVKNFSSFHKFIEKHGVIVKNINTRRAWITAYGNYENLKGVLGKRASLLSKLSVEEIYIYEVQGVNLFKVARAEVMARVVAQPEWHGSDYPQTTRGIFECLIEQNKSVLMLALIAAWDWIEYWTQALAEKELFTHACIFSGSLIYQRSLMELLRYTPTKVIVMESFFTGNDYYCEEKYEPIANNTNLKHKTVFESLVHNDEPASLLDRERIKAINKVLTMKNKNVQQPETGEPLVFEHEGDIVTICGQVVNDFSLLEYRNKGLCSIAIYKKLISELASSGFNVVFKAHPWEEEKTNIGRPLTRDAIIEYVNKQPEILQQRVKIVDHYPIDKLFSISYSVIGLNSQSLIEAAFHGFKPIQFGDAFYGKKGFTHDFTPDQISEVVINLQQGSLAGSLSLTEYRYFENFLVIALQRYLVSNFDSGIKRLEQVFDLPKNISLSLTATGVAHKTTVKEPNKTLSEDKTSASKESSLIPIANVLKIPSSLERKFLKLRRNPKKFFSDSQNSVIRTLHYFF